MENQNINDEVEIDLSQLLRVVRKNIKAIVIAGLVGVVIAGVITTFGMSRQYQSTGSVLLKADVVSGSIDTNQLNANRLMVNNYIELLQGNNVQGQVADHLSMDINDIRGALSVTNSTDTQIIEITATTANPELSKNIVDEAISVFTAVIQEKLDINNLTIVDQPEINESPVSPSLTRNMIIGLLGGVVIVLAYLFITFILDTRIKSSDEAEKYLGIPYLGSVPYFEER